MNLSQDPLVSYKNALHTIASSLFASLSVVKRYVAPVEQIARTRTILALVVGHGALVLLS